MIEDCLKLTTYCAERDRAHGRFLADAMVDLYERRGLLASVVVRGVEGFGSRHQLHTDRLLTLSEDLPIVTAAVDTRARIQDAVREVAALATTGLVTLERARMITGTVGAVTLETGADEAVKLTVFVGRGERVDRSLAYRAVVELMHRHGVSGATVFAGVDGTVEGGRRRARFFARNAGVPVMVVGLGTASSVAALLPQLDGVLRRPMLLLERVRICKLAGRRLTTPGEVPQADPSGLPLWQMLTIYSRENDRHEERPLYTQLIGRLRAAGASGATALRGVWGYQGEQVPHGDGLFSPRRAVPVVTTVIDTPERTRRWYEVVDELTAESGMVTSEIVPAVRAASSGRGASALHLEIHRD